MKLHEIAERIGGRLVCSGASGGAEIERAYAGDTISDLLEHARADTILVTHLHNPQLARVAELMDVPAVCLLDGVSPDDELVRAIAAQGTGLIVSPEGIEETSRRLSGLLDGSGRGR
jgi:hypothetical protein